MKKKFIILVLLICFCCSGLFANDFWGFNNRPASFVMDFVCLGFGGTCIALPTILDAQDTDAAYYAYGAGGAFILIGFIGLLYDIVVDDSSYAKAIEKDPIFKHVSFGTNGKDSYLGAKFSF
jgi:hypothetical protein